MDLVEVLSQLANTNKKLLLVDATGKKTEVPYRQLWNRSFRLQKILKEKYQLKRESKVMIQCEDNETFLYAFWACAIGGFVSVPIDATQKKNRKKLLLDIHKRVDAEVIISDVEPISIDGTEFINIGEYAEEILNCGDYTAEQVESAMEDILYIQYTSGSTGQPHGVIITKENVAADSYGYGKHLGITDKDKFLTWSPLTHCFSIITFHLLPIMQEAEQCIMSTELYMSNPLLWADLITEYQPTRVSSLPFALKHFVNVYKKTTIQPNWNLNSVQSLVLAGERINYGLCKEFCDAVGAYGLDMSKVYAMYGLSEATVTVGGNRFGEKLKRCRLNNLSLTIGESVCAEEIVCEEPFEQEFMETGTILENIQLTIRDEQQKSLPEGVLGYVYISGPAVTKGYYKEKELNRKVFLDGKWLYTGDVGFLKESRLYLVGRDKEIVVANGKKVASTTLEELIQPLLAGTDYVQAIVSNGVDSNLENEKVIAFLHTEKNDNQEEKWEKLYDIKERIKQEVFEKTGLTINEVIPVYSVPKTASGKLFRRKLTEQYNNGSFREVKDKMRSIEIKQQSVEGKLGYARHEVESKIISFIESIYKVKVQSLSCPFNEYGIVSINIPAFIDAINDMFGIHLEAGELFRYFTIEKLVNYITNLTANEKEEPSIEKKETKENDERIAIIGMSCRFPGGANDIDKFWELLISHRDGVSDAPEERWDVDKYYDPDKDAPGKTYCRKGGYLDYDINEFDARFFNISPKEANALDPQQRLLLELTWEAFENANLNIEHYNGSNTGVYLGICSNEWYMSQLYSGDLSTINPYSLTGTCFSTACGRISYTFGFQGPCATVDTACSSSLTALHFACSGLLAKEADMQIVGGVNLIESPACNVGFSKLQATSTDGYSKSFDASANGYSRGEGGGIIILKRLSDAIRDQNEILGVIRGTGINQDGKSNGLTAPNGEAQERLIRRTMVGSGVEASQIDYVEMHGTGTKLGDPIEVGAVAATYGAGHTNADLLKIGSVKSNIGHLEGAAGVASIIKVLLSLRNNMIPANLHFQEPNPFIDWEHSHIKVVAENTPWVKENGLRIAAVNGFGFGGSNAHVIIEEYKPENVSPQKEAVQDGIQYMLKITAQSEKALKQLVTDYEKLLESIPDEQLESVIYTTNIGRADLKVRLVVCGENREELLQRLKDYQKNGYAEGVISNTEWDVQYREDRKTVFMFTGQGSQYVGMGKLLYETNEAFRNAFDECNKLFRPYLGCSITDVLYGKCADAEVITKTVYAQPIIFAIEYALYKVWEQAGVKPEIVMGHSIGEFAAAVAAEVMSLEDAVKLVAARGKLMDMAPGHGKMATLYATEEQVMDWIKDYPDTVCIAAKNALTTCVISGAYDDVDTVEKEAAKAGCRVQELTVSHAFHSMLMEPILDEFCAIASDITFHAPKIRFISALYGREVGPQELLDARYWTDHVRDRVDFHKAIMSIQKPEEYLFLEVGASRVLAALAKMNLEDHQAIAATLNRNQEDKQYLPKEMATIYAAGVNLKWEQIHFTGKRVYEPIHLPNYPYNKKHYGMELKFDRQDVSGWSEDCHPILGQRIDLPMESEATIYQSKFTTRDPYFMQEHIIFNTAISPAAAHTSMLLLATEQLSGAKSCVLSNMEFHAPLAVSQNQERQVQLYVEQDGEKPAYRILSRDGKTKQGKWLLHTQGIINMFDTYQEENLHGDIESYKKLKYQEDIDDTIYDFMSDTGFLLGEGFRRIKCVHRGSDESISVIEPLKTVPYYKEYNLYPGIIDSVFQTGFHAILEQLRAATNDDSSKTVIPYFIEKITYNYRQSDRLWCYTKSRLEDGINYADMVVYNENGEVVLKVDNFMAKVTDQSSLLRELSSISKLYYHPVWQEEKANKDALAEAKKTFMENAKDTQIILIADDVHLLEVFGAQWRKEGLNPLEATLGDSYTKCSEERYTLRFCQEEDWKQLIQDVVATGKKEYRFFYVTGTDGEEDYKQAMDYSSIKGLFYLAKEINNPSYAGKKTLTIVTKNVQKTENETITNLAGAMVWGFAKTVSLEYPECYQGILDIDKEACSNEDMLAEVLTGAKEEVCYRGNQRYTTRLIAHAAYEKKKTVKDKTIKIKENATYVITGGTGALAKVYAKQLVKEGAKNLILVARHKPAGAVQAAIQGLMEEGATVKIACADVCDQQALSAAIQVAARNLPPIKGVIHAAGVLRDKMLMDMDWSSFEMVLRPKTEGTLKLYQTLKDNSLDFFIMLSSITSIVGNMGQANYAAANYFMNQFAGYLRQNQIPGFTFCWGPWNEAGMATSNDAIGTSMDRMGLTLLSKEVGQRAVEEFFEQPYENVLIADVDWDKLASSMKQAKGRKEFLSELVSGEVKTSDTKQGENSSNKTLEDYKKLPEDQRYNFVVEQLMEVYGKIMGFDKGQIMVNETFTSQGADSLMIFSMCAATNQMFKTEMLVSLFFTYPTIEKMAEYLIHDAIVND